MSDELQAGSLDMIEIVMAFEEEFSCEIPDDAAAQIQTVGDAVQFIETRAPVPATQPQDGDTSRVVPTGRI